MNEPEAAAPLPAPLSENDLRWFVRPEMNVETQAVTLSYLKRAVVEIRRLRASACAAQTPEVRASKHEKHQPEACIACGERNDGGYMVEDGPGPFCSQCWQLLERNFFA